VSAPYRIERLAGQDRSAFSCGEPELDQYFRRYIGQDVRRDIARAFVALTSPGEIAGFYTLSASSVRHEDLPPGSTRKLPRYPVLPAVLIGRLAVALDHQAVGLGFALLADAVTRVSDAEIGACLVLVDAKTEAAMRFYQRHGFAPLDAGHRRLFLPVGRGLTGLGR